MDAMIRCTTTTTWGVGAVVLAAVLFGTTSTAEARHRPCAYPASCKKVWIAPVYRTERMTVPCAPVYETRERRIWQEPVYELRTVEVHVPAVVVTKKIPIFGIRGITGYKVVETVVETAYTTFETQRVLVRPGRYETVYDRILVVPASTKVVRKRVLVRAGYWSHGRCIVVRGHRKVGHRGHGVRQVVHRVEHGHRRLDIRLRP